MGTQLDADKERPVVIVTGANKGSGLYLTWALLHDGYRVAALNLSGDNLASGTVD